MVQGKASYSNFKCEVYVPKKNFLSAFGGGGLGGIGNHSTLKEITKILSEYNFRCSGIISTTNQ